MNTNIKFAVLGIILLPVFSTVFAQQWQYVVKPGDTLWTIADEYLISESYVNRLQKYNSVKDPLKLQPGTTITAPVQWLGNLPGAATIILLAGEVKATRENEHLQAEIGLGLETGDEIITGENGIAVLEFSDNSTLKIFSNTELSFVRFKQSYDGSVVKARISVKYGRIKVDANSEKKPGHRLEIESPAAVTAVRGTEFRVGVDGEKGDTVTELLSGKVAVYAQQSSVALQKFYGTKTQTGKAPMRPVRLIQAPDLVVEDTIESKRGGFSWQSVARAQSFRVRVASDEAFTDIVYDKIVFSTEVNDIFFPEDGEFFTSVRAIDSNDIEGIDAIAGIFVNARPEPPLILEPKNDTSTFDSMPAFSWAIPAQSIMQLRYQLSDNENFDPLLIDETIDPSDSFTVTEDLPAGDYFWRVANIDSQGMGPFSNASKLSVAQQPALAPDIDESGSSVSLSLSQDAAVSRYHVQVSRDKDFNQIIHEEWTGDEEFSFNTQGAGSYFVRLGIEASEGSGEVHYSDAQKIIVPFQDWKQLIISIATALLIIL